MRGVNMTHTKDGRNKKREPALCCLLPGGAAAEKIRGISHLFEHMVIFRLLHDYPRASVFGHTSEDYIVLFCRGLDHRDVTESLRQMTFQPGEVQRHKQMLIKEIERESLNSEEAFFSFLWQGTPYEKSPLGTIKNVRKISPAMLESFRWQITEKPLFFYDSRSGLKTVNPGPAAAPGLLLGLQPRRDAVYRNGAAERHMDIFYFNDSIEALHLLVKALKILNPDKQIQLSEKKRAGAFVMEKGVRFPTGAVLPPLRRQALEALQNEAAAIKKNPEDRALNELESIYFYGKSWQERMDELSRTTAADLRRLLGAIETAARPAP